MSADKAIDLLFGSMEKLGPGSNEDTLHVLHLLPRKTFNTVVDAGCGTGRQTIALAQDLGKLIHAVDSHAPFLEALKLRAKQQKVEHLIDARCMDMKDIPGNFQHIDLLWSEGAAYNIGFANALSIWANAIIPHGLLVVSELSWIKEQVPGEVVEFFHAGYPDMRSTRENLTVVKNAGYNVLMTHTLPDRTWTEGYYDELEPRAESLIHHPDASVRDFAVETLKEIEIFRRSESCYGYVFYVLQRA